MDEPLKETPRLRETIRRAWLGDQVAQRVVDNVLCDGVQRRDQRVRDYEQSGRPVERLRGNAP